MIEAKRGCGFRKVGGLYLVGAGLGVTCDRLPYRIEVCPTCGEGIKPSRGIRWMDGKKFFGGNCDKLLQETFLPGEIQKEPVADCHLHHCAICNSDELGKVGLMWVGEKYYPTPEIFITEAQWRGVCKRIPAVPKDVDLGKTWVLLAHPKGIEKRQIDKHGKRLMQTPTGLTFGKIEHYPGIFYAFKPTKIEMIVTDQTPPEEIEKLKERGITPVVVPHDDPDHNPKARENSPVKMSELAIA